MLNEHHKSEVILSANVVPKTLILESDKVEFPMSEHEDAFPRNSMSIEVRNTIRSPVHFAWQQPENSSFSIFPKEGTIKKSIIQEHDIELIYTHNIYK